MSKTTYKIRIIETLVRDVNVEAENESDAIRIANREWRDGIHILDEHDFMNVEFFNQQ